MCTAHTTCSTLHGVMLCLCSQQHSSPLEATPTRPYWLLFAIFGNHGQFFLYSTVVATSCPPSCPLCYMFLPDTSVFSLGGTYSASTLLWGTVFRGEHFSVPCRYHLQHSYDKHNMGHYSIQCIENQTVSWLQVLRLSYTRLDVMLCNRLFVVPYI